MKIAVIALYASLVVFAVAQEKKPDVTGVTALAIVPANGALSETQQNKLLKAQHALDVANKNLSDLQMSWVNLQQQAEEIKKKFEGLSKASEKAEQDYQAEIKNAAVAAGLDPAKYTFDREKLVFNPLASPAPVTPSPAKNRWVQER